MKNSDTALTIVLPVARQFEKTGDSGSRRFPGGLGAAEPAACWWVGGCGREAQSHSSPRVAPDQMCGAHYGNFISFSAEHHGPPAALLPPSTWACFWDSCCVRGGGPGLLLVKGPPVPVAHSRPSPPQLPDPASQLLTHQSTFSLPLLRCRGRIERGTFAYSLSPHHD